MTMKWWKAGLLVLTASLMVEVPSARGLTATFSELLSTAEKQDDGSVIVGPGQSAIFGFTTTSPVGPITDPVTQEEFLAVRMCMYGKTPEYDISSTRISIANGETTPTLWCGFFPGFQYNAIWEYSLSDCHLPGDGLNADWFQFSVIVGTNSDYLLGSFRFVQVSVPADAAADTGVCITSVLAPPFTPDEMINDLIKQVQVINSAAGIPNGTENSLEAKLQNAVDALEEAKKNCNATAANKLEAFCNEVEAQYTAHRLNLEQRDSLISEAQAIIKVLVP